MYPFFGFPGRWFNFDDVGREFHGEDEAANSNGSRPRKLADSSLCLANFTTSGTKAPLPRNKKSNHGLLTSPRNSSPDARRIDSRIFSIPLPFLNPPLAIKTCPFRSFVPFGFEIRRIDASLRVNPTSVYLRSTRARVRSRIVKFSRISLPWRKRKRKRKRASQVST